MHKIEREELKSVLVAGGEAKIQNGGNMLAGDITMGDITAPGGSAEANAEVKVVIKP